MLLAAWLLLISQSSVVAQVTETCRADDLPDSLVVEWAKSVPVLKATRASANEYGLGLVVGWEGTHHWIATAAHVLTANEGDYSIGSTIIEVTFPEESRPVKLCDNIPPKIVSKDIAFVCVERRPYSFASEAVLASKVASADAVRILGKSGEFLGSARVALLPNMTGRIDSVISDGTLRVQGLTGNARGQSGAPIMSQRGIAGLYLGLESDSVRSRAISIATVESSAAQARVPWSLTEYESYDCNLSRSVCPKLDGPPKISRALWFTRNSGGKAYRIANDQCMPLPEGRYSVRADGSMLECPTMLLSIRHASQPLQLSEQCSLSLQGIWSRGNASLSCSNTSPGVARCSGLMELGYGAFSGQLSVNGIGAVEVKIIGSFTGSFGGVTAATGKLEITNEGLRGSIAREGLSPVDLVLQR